MSAHPVDSHGLHWDDNIAWLLQGKKGTNFVGLKANCPFVPPRKKCNHQIPTAAPIPDPVHWETFSKILSDPLVQSMLPIPHGKESVYFEDPYNELGIYLTNLSRLGSPILPIVKPMWTIKLKDLEDLLSESNIQPIIFVQATTKEQPLVDAVGKLSGLTPRSVIITGSADIVVSPPLKRETTQIQKFDIQDLITLPLENLGALLIRRYSRKEALDAPVERREDRRNRLIRERTRK